MMRRPRYPPALRDATVEVERRLWALALGLMRHRNMGMVRVARMTGLTRPLVRWLKYRSEEIVPASEAEVDRFIAQWTEWEPEK